MGNTTRIAHFVSVRHLNVPGEISNRANGRLQIFNTKEDYKIFEKLLLETKELVNVVVVPSI